MNPKSHPIGFLLVALALLSLASSALAQSSPETVEAQIRRLLRERLDAYAKGDAVAWARYVDADCLCAGSTRAGLQKEISSRPSPVKNWYGDIRDLTVRVRGDVAVARYRITEFTEIGAQRLEIEEWRAETHVRQGGSWALLGAADVVVPRDPAIAKVEPRVLDAYAGQYEYAPGVRDTVTREGGHLFIQATGQEKEEIFPEDERTYFGKAQDWRVIFTRDGQGRVTSLAFRQNGQDLVAKRVP
jgi:hypothetical protein